MFRGARAADRPMKNALQRDAPRAFFLGGRARLAARLNAP